MWERTIEDHAATLQPVPTTGLGNDVAAWLQDRASEHRHGLRWLLAHADDGVVWGRLDSGVLVTAHAHGFGPALLRSTLQQARLFGDTGELLLWQGGSGGFRARLIADTADAARVRWRQSFDECQMLWGETFDPARKRWRAADVGALTGGFRLYRHGVEGLRHAAPHDPASPPPVDRAPRLKVRHYLNPQGFARIEASRLVDVVYP